MDNSPALDRSPCPHCCTPMVNGLCPDPNCAKHWPAREVLPSKDESLQQRAMSFLSTLVNTQRWNYAQAYDLVREMLDAKWNVPEAKPSRKYLNLGREYVRDHLKTIEGGTAVCLFAIWLDSRTQAAETAKVEPSKDRVPDHELREYIEELEPGHTFHRLLTELALLRALTDMPVAATETGLTACAMCADGVGREYGYHMVNGEQIECPAVKRAHETFVCREHLSKPHPACPDCARAARETEAKPSNDAVAVLSSLLMQAKPYIIRADREGPHAHPRVLLNQINLALEASAEKSEADPFSDLPREDA